jgi:ribose transport system ATP-binding protein
MEEELAICMRNITKRFPGVLAVDNSTLEVKKGEVHVIAGENGAGKSTLIKILAGVYRKDSGDIFLGGKKLRSIHRRRQQN